MRSESTSNYDGLAGSVLMCEDCQRPTVHFQAPGGVPVCGFCGATPVDADHFDPDQRDDQLPYRSPWPGRSRQR